MTETRQDNAPFVLDAGPQMVKVTRDGSQEVTAEIASRALIWIGENDRVAFKEGMAWAMLGDK